MTVFAQNSSIVVHESTVFTSRLTESRNARSEQLNTCGVYRIANQQSLACLSGSERRRPGWFLDMKYQTCFSQLQTFTMHL